MISDDVKGLIALLNQLNFKNCAHQEQLKSAIEVLGTGELMGKDPDQ